MTRVTNFGRKRTYVEAGFNADPQTITDVGESLTAVQETADDQSNPEANGTNEDTVQPPKKKRKRTKKSKRGVEIAAKDIAGGDSAGDDDIRVEKDSALGPDGQTAGVKEGPTQKSARQKKRDREKRERERRLQEKLARANNSETRRQKRISERQADTTCFACREKGHAAKDCPVTRSNPDGMGTEKSGGKPVVGICYRCGSTKHTLARCKKPIDSTNPLPFASCFVCTGKGHLASACPQNKARGVYPNGGCCKLCGDTSHLAKNCGLRKNEVVDGSVMLGTGREAGADEDDFHSFKRRKTEVDRDEKQEDRVKRLIDIKAGAHSGIVKSFGKPPITSKKKVVYF